MGGRRYGSRASAAQYGAGDGEGEHEERTMSEQDQDYGFETLAIHAGAAPDPTTGARATPIYQTTSFVFDDVDHAASLFNLQRFGNIYSRITNPTVSVLEERIAALEGGTAACAVASGHAAQFVAFLNLMAPGDEIISSTKLYGGSITQFSETFPKFDWRVRFVDPTRPKQFKKALKKRTKAIFVESASNPDGVVCDLEAIAEIAHGAGVPLVVDNTMPTPYLCQPVRHGADIVVHSMTKYIGGHGNSMGGVIVDGGTFDWFQNDKFPALTAPTKAYHGIRFAETFGDFGFAMRCKAVGLRDTGPCLSPFNAFLLLMGVETLPLQDAAPRRERPGGRRIPGRATRWSRGSPIPACRAARSTTWPGATCPRAPARCSPSGSRAATTWGSRWSRAASCSRISRTSATPAR